MKPPPTRKLRRRPNDPAPAQEKRRKPVSNQLNFQLEDKQMEDDLRLIAKGKLTQQQPAKKSSRSRLGEGRRAEKQADGWLTPFFIANQHPCI